MCRNERGKGQGGGGVASSLNLSTLIFAANIGSPTDRLRILDIACIYKPIRLKSRGKVPLKISTLVGKDQPAVRIPEKLFTPPPAPLYHHVITVSYNCACIKIAPSFCQHGKYI